jgi:hypothetical protein
MSIFSVFKISEQTFLSASSASSNARFASSASFSALAFFACISTPGSVVERSRLNGFKHRKLPKVLDLADTVNIFALNPNASTLSASNITSMVRRIADILFDFKI